MEFIVVFVYLK